MPKEYISTPNTPNGPANCSSVQTLVDQAGVKIHRIGGNGYDENGISIGTTALTNDYITAINNIKAVNLNAKFLIQIPFESSLINSANMSPNQAATMVFNIRTAFPSDQFYYSIGNEWDKYSPAFTSAQIQGLIKTYSVKIKGIDPNYKVVAPALAYYTAQDANGNQIIPRLIGGVDDVTGIITGSGDPNLDNIKYYVDVIDFHTYAGGSNGDMSGLNSSNYSTYRTNSINYPFGGFMSDLNDLQTRLNTVNAGRSSSPLAFAITEMNIVWKNPTPPAPNSTDPYENTNESLGCRSFFAGQYWAEMFSAMLKSGTTTGNAKVEFVMPWSIHESGGDGDYDDLGMTKDPVVNCSPAPTPVSTYWHLQLCAKYIHGNYCGGTTSNNIKSFGCKYPSGIAVMLMNQNQNLGPQVVNISLSSTGGCPTSGLNVNIDANINKCFSIKIPDETTFVIFYDKCGNPQGLISYGINDAAPSPLQSIYYNPYLICSKWTEASTLKCAGATTTPIYTGTLTSNTLITDSAWINDTLIVPDNATLTIDTADVVMEKDAVIKIAPKGKLVITGSFLHTWMEQTGRVLKCWEILQMPAV